MFHVEHRAGSWTYRKGRIMRLSDNGAHSIYRVKVQFTARDCRSGGDAVVYVKASSPSVASEWLLSYPHLAGITGATGDMTVLNARKVRHQPVWLKKSGTRTARFDLRSIERWGSLR